MIDFTDRVALYQQVLAANADYRAGRLIDEQSPGLLDGSRIRAELAMQSVGVFEAILEAGSGDDPDDSDETRRDSQVMDNLVRLMIGRVAFGSVSGNSGTMNVTSLTPTPTPTLFSGMHVAFNNTSVTPSPTTQIAAFGNSARSVRYRGGSTAAIEASDLQGLVTLTFNAVGNWWELPYPPPPSAVTIPQVETFRQAITYSGGAALAFSHGLSGVPQTHYVEATNVVADSGFAVGDLIRLYPSSNERNWYTYTRGANTIRVHTGTDGVGIFDGSGNFSSFTPTNFTYELVAKYNPLDLG